MAAAPTCDQWVQAAFALGLLIGVGLGYLFARSKED